jgi:hypothetical protein
VRLVPREQGTYTVTFSVSGKPGVRLASLMRDEYAPYGYVEVDDPFDHVFDFQAWRQTRWAIKVSYTLCRISVTILMIRLAVAWLSGNSTQALSQCAG